MIVRLPEGVKLFKVTGIWDHNRWEAIGGDVVCKCPKCIMCQPPVPTDVEADMQMKAEEAMKKFGVTGFLVAPGDTHTLERLLQRLLTDRLLVERIGAAGRQSVRLRYSPERAVPRIEALYADAGVPRLAAAPITQPELKKAA